MTLFVQVANEIALTSSSLMESNSETDLDDDIVDDAVEIKSLTPPEEIAALWAPKVTEVCLPPTSPERSQKSHIGQEQQEPIDKEKDMRNENEGKETIFNELRDEVQSEDVVSEVQIKTNREKVMSEEKIGKELLEKLNDIIHKDDSELGGDKLSSTETNGRDKDEKSLNKEEEKPASTKNNYCGNWTDVVFPEVPSKSLPKKLASQEEKSTPKKVENKNSDKIRSNWTDVIFKKDSQPGLKTKTAPNTGAMKGGSQERAKLQNAISKEDKEGKNSFEQKSSRNWTDVVFKKDSGTTLSSKKTASKDDGNVAVENRPHENIGSQGQSSFQNSFEQSVLKSAEKPPLPAAYEFNNCKDVTKENENKAEDVIEKILLENGNREAELSEAELDNRETEEEIEQEVNKEEVLENKKEVLENKEVTDQVKDEGTTGTEGEEETNGCWKIDFIRVETQAKDDLGDKKIRVAGGQEDQEAVRPKREKLSKRKKERRRERRKGNQAAVAAVKGSSTEDNGFKSTRRPITVDTTLPRKSENSEKVVEKEVGWMFFIQEQQILRHFFFAKEFLKFKTICAERF